MNVVIGPFKDIRIISTDMFHDIFIDMDTMLLYCHVHIGEILKNYIYIKKLVISEFKKHKIDIDCDLIEFHEKLYDVNNHEIMNVKKLFKINNLNKSTLFYLSLKCEKYIDLFYHHHHHNNNNSFIL